MFGDPTCWDRNLPSYPNLGILKKIIKNDEAKKGTRDNW
jgi:hypothetical protein